MKLSQQSPLRPNNSSVKEHIVFLVHKLWATVRVWRKGEWDGRGKEEEGINFESTLQVTFI